MILIYISFLYWVVNAKVSDLERKQISGLLHEYNLVLTQSVIFPLAQVFFLWLLLSTFLWFGPKQVHDIITMCMPSKLSEM